MLNYLSSAFWGMSLRYPAAMGSPLAFWFVSGLTGLVTAGLLCYLKRRGHFSQIAKRR